MRKLAVAAMGMNGKSITAEALEAVKEAGVLCGSERALEEFSYLNKKSFIGYTPKAIREIGQRTDAMSIVVLVSGDSGFYSASSAILRELYDWDVTIYPGISSVSYFASRLGVSWQDARLLSAHGLNPNIADELRRNREVFCLTGKNVSALGKRLCDAGFGDLDAWLGENLGYDSERIEKMKIRELPKVEASSLTILYLKNPKASKEIRTGIADSEFSRFEGVPMTKSEVRAVALSKLGLSPESICYDIGAGSGSVSVEMGLSAYRGRVYAIEREEKCQKLILENACKFGLGNVELIHGSAPKALSELPAPDGVFIGGSGGSIEEIIGAVLEKNPKARIVCSAIAVESTYRALKALEEKNVSNIELVQLSVSKGRKAGSLNLLMGQNPVSIISGGGKDV